MTRRDTIIVAVLINAGLLVMLFISALKQEPAPTAVISAHASAPIKEEKKRPLERENVLTKKESSLVKTSPDRVDHLLAQYSKTMTKETQEKQEERAVDVKSVEPVKVESKVVAAPVKVETPLTNREGQKKVVVKKGDVLEKLAKTYGTSVEAIMEANALIDVRLQVGQVLFIPKEKGQVNAKPAAPAEERYYVIKNGDNLWKIAVEHHVKVEDLLRLNQMSEKQAKALRPGDKIKIP